MQTLSWLFKELQALARDSDVWVYKYGAQVRRTMRGSAQCQVSLHLAQLIQLVLGHHALTSKNVYGYGCTLAAPAQKKDSVIYTVPNKPQNLYE